MAGTSYWATWSKLIKTRKKNHLSHVVSSAPFKLFAPIEQCINLKKVGGQQNEIEVGKIFWTDINVACNLGDVFQNAEYKRKIKYNNFFAQLSPQNKLILSKSD